MKIRYLNCNNEKRLFSFYTHDYQTYKGEDGTEYMIDGGLEGLCRASLSGKIETKEISEVIEDIREQFQWTQNYDKNNNRIEPVKRYLKDLSTDHILGILKYFTEHIDINEDIDYRITVQGKAIHLIFIEELLYRSKNNTL